MGFNPGCGWRKTRYESGDRGAFLAWRPVFRPPRPKNRVPLSGHFSIPDEPRAEAPGYFVRPFHGQNEIDSQIVTMASARNTVNFIEQ